MLKRDELTTETSCLNRAAMDEPIFVLRANDDVAAETVLDWIHNYIRDKEGLHKLTPQQQAKVTEARDLAKMMTIWKATRL